MHTLATATKPIERIDARAHILANYRADLADLVTEIEAAKRAIVTAYRRKLREAFNRAAAAQSELHAEIAAAPELFEKPRTITLHGLKLGYQKGKGKVVIADEARTIALIKKHLDPEVAETVIKTEESVIRKAAANLPASDLKRVGIEIEDTTDEVVIRPADSELDKLLDRLLAEVGKEES
jgi:hypothetical protein